MGAESGQYFKVLRSWLTIERAPSYLMLLIWHGSLAAFSGGIVAVATFMNPSTLPLPACRFLALTGKPCPFCGYTRAFHDLATGNWTAAIYNCPASVLLFLLLCCIFVWNLIPIATGRYLKPGPNLQLTKHRTLVIIVFFAISVLANWLYRLSMGFS